MGRGGNGRKKPLLRLLDAVSARSGALSTLFLCIGVAGLLALPLFERKVKFDEKSLMAGGARPSIR